MLSVHTGTACDNRVGTNAATRGQPIVDWVVSVCAKLRLQRVRVLETRIKGSELLNFDATCDAKMQCFGGAQSNVSGVGVAHPIAFTPPPMPRPTRVILPGVPTHIIQRGHNRARCFFSDGDFEEYREILLEMSQRYQCSVHAYVLMTNHVHLLASALNSSGMSQMMQTIGGRYVRSVNLRQRRTGTLWEGRFRSSTIDSERYFLTCSRYIELNPVRARMVGDVHEYPWSSYRHNAYGENDAIVTSYSLYDALGVTPQLRRRAYRELFRQAIEPEFLDSIRDAAQRGAALGDAAFVQRMEMSARRPIARFAHGGDRRSPIHRLAASL